MKSSIENFPLVWRWTQETHSVLPNDVLDQLSPLDTDSADQLAQEVLPLYDGWSKLKSNQFLLLQSCNDPDPSSFFNSLGHNDETIVFLSWDNAKALRTTWEIFSRYWDDFFYPASDDLTIVPEDKSWVLAYHHDEIFEYGKR